MQQFSQAEWPGSGGIHIRYYVEADSATTDKVEKTLAVLISEGKMLFVYLRG